MRLGTLNIAAGFAVAATAAFLVFTSATNCRTVTGDGEVAVDTSGLRPGRAELFCYTGKSGEKLRFVLARGSDGVVRSVFDACRQCYVYHRGYLVSGGDLVCRVCGNRYRIDRMTEGKASCVPASLPHREAAGTVRIRTADLESGRALF